MRLSLRIAELMREHGLEQRGIVTELTEALKLDRHTVAGLLKGSTQRISVEALGRLCHFLVTKAHVPQSALPGALFRWDPDEFWGLFRSKKTIDFCLGVRGDSSDPERRMINEADAMLQAELLQRITDAKAQHSTIVERFVLAYEHGSSPGNAQQGHYGAAKVAGDETYQQFTQRDRNAALLCIGSMKCNPVTEMVIANAFGLSPFGQDPVHTVENIVTPFFFEYRASDAKVPSCAGGEVFARSLAGPPGIWYKDQKQGWVCAKCDSSNDVALVLYKIDLRKDKLELVLAGFSARSTRCLARCLSEVAGELWPPIDVGNDVRCGAFVVLFELEAGPNSTVPPPFPLHKAVRVVKLEELQVEPKLKGRPRRKQKRSQRKL